MEIDGHFGIKKVAIKHITGNDRSTHQPANVINTANQNTQDSE